MESKKSWEARKWLTNNSPTALKYASTETAKQCSTSTSLPQERQYVLSASSLLNVSTERSTKYVYVNPPRDIDLNFQQYSLTERCITLEKSLLEEKRFSLKLQGTTSEETRAVNCEQGVKNSLKAIKLKSYNRI